LRSSPWGDPGPGPVPEQAATLRWALAARAAHAPAPGPEWARTWALLLLASQRFGGEVTLAPTAERHARALLPRAALHAPDLPGLAQAGEVAGLDTLGEVREPRDLWRAEARWWGALDEASRRLLVGRAGSDMILGAVAMLSADAWRLRAALVAAASGGRGLEVLTEMARNAPG
jgi:hypothetical protein